MKKYIILADKSTIPTSKIIRMGYLSPGDVTKDSQSTKTIAGADIIFWVQGIPQYLVGPRFAKVDLEFEMQRLREEIWGDE